MYKKISLDNGLRIVLSPKKESKIIAVVVLIKSGSDYDKKEVKGIHHFIEHLPFKGTNKRPLPEEVAKVIEGKGGALNAFTEPEIMGFLVKISSEYLKTALEVLSDMLFNAQFKPEEIKREREVILREIDEQTDYPRDYLQNVLWYKVCYGDQPAGWPILGTKETIKTINRKAILEHFDNHFRSEGVVVSVAGNFNEEEAERLIKKYFSGIKAGKSPKKPELKEFQTHPQLLIAYRETEQTYLSLGVKTPGINLFSPERNALSLLATILGGNMSSRLFVLVRERMGGAYGIRTNFDLDTDRGYLVTDAGIENSQLIEITSLILKEYQRIREEVVSEEELERAKEYLKGKITMELDDLVDLAYFYGGQELLLNRIYTIEEEIEDCLKFTPKDIQNIAKRIFQPQNLNLAVLGPQRKNKELLNLLKNF